MRYADRTHAGTVLATSLRHVATRNPLVLGLPRGGIPVAVAVASALGCQADVLLVRKLGVPWQPELAFGAIGESGIRVLNRSVLRSTQLTDREIDSVTAAEEIELRRRVTMFRQVYRAIPLDDRVVVIVDDGIATGATVIAAIDVARSKGAARVIVAVPVAAPDSARRVAARADEFISPYQPPDLGSVGAVYNDFHQLSDEEAIVTLRL